MRGDRLTVKTIFCRSPSPGHHHLQSSLSHYYGMC